MSVNEKIGMQSLERLHANKPARPGLVERIEFEYHRHGTLCLIANSKNPSASKVRPGSSSQSKHAARSCKIPPTRMELNLIRNYGYGLALRHRI